MPHFFSAFLERIRGWMPGRASVKASAYKEEESQVLRRFLRASVRDVMRQWHDVLALSIDSCDRGKLLDVLEKIHYSVIPVYGASLDDIRGCLYVGDLACAVLKSSARIESYVKRVLFVVPSLRLVKLLHMMRNTKTHLAIVLDEHGGTDGVVLMDDILDLFFQIDEPQHCIVCSNNKCELSGRVELEVLEKELKINLCTEEMSDDIETLGGLILFLRGEVPKVGDIVHCENGVRFVILDADERSVIRVLVDLSAVRKHDRE